MPVALAAAGQPATAEAGPELQTERRQDDRQLPELLARLPDIQRSAVALRHVVGLTTAELSQVLRCPEGTAKSHVSRRSQPAASTHHPGGAIMTSHVNLTAVTAGTDDRLLSALAGLATAAPADLGERIFARFVRVPGPVGPALRRLHRPGHQLCPPGGRLRR